MDKVSYPQHCNQMDFPFRQVNLKKWHDARLKINTIQRFHNRFDKDRVIESVIKGWDLVEKNMFKRWFDYLENGNEIYAGNMSMKKVAYDFTTRDKKSKFLELKNKLRSRIRSIEQLLNELADQGLLESDSTSQSKFTFLSRILQRLREEVNTLSSPLMLEARHQRMLKLLKQANIVEGVNILEDSIQLANSCVDRSLVKYAQQTSVSSEREQLQKVIDIVGLEIKELSYKIHLKRMYQALQILDNLGRSSDVDTVARVIKDDLPELDKTNKRLMEVFTHLSQIKAESEVFAKLRS